MFRRKPTWPRAATDPRKKIRSPGSPEPASRHVGPLVQASRLRFHRIWLVVQNHAQQRAVDLDMAIVGDEPQVAKLVHEMADARARGADHFGERLLADLGDDRLRPA